MKKYVFFRILRSLFSIFLVTTLTYLVIFTLVPRDAIFKDDPSYNKLRSNPEELTEYKNTAFHRMGYIDYVSPRELIHQVSEKHPDFKGGQEGNDKAEAEEWAKENGYKLDALPESGNLYATKDIAILTRVFNFYKNMIQIDHPGAVKDPNNPDLERGYSFENDPYAGWALVGSGTKYKYQIYFNKHFPFIHQNMIKLNLGISYPTFAGRPVTQVLFGGQGQPMTREVTLPDGSTRRTSLDVYTRQYKPSDKISSQEKAMFSDNYAGAENVYKDPSMAGISFRMGIVAVFIAYAIAIPAAAAMALYKGGWVDRFGTFIVTILISVPSVAFVFFFRFLGNKFFNLPDLFPTHGAGDIRSYISPTIILGLLSVSGLIIWMRRYMIDQQNSDYVKFARAKGLSEGEIQVHHILRNAIIPLVNGIPGSIIFTIAGATITETIFAAPGMGKMLPDAILAHNNPIVTGLVLIFTILAVLALLLGDIAMTLVDPRITLNVRGDE